MEKLFEHTLQRQVASQTKEVSELKAQVAELATLLKGQLAIVADSPRAWVESAAQVNVGPVTNSTVVTQQNNTIIMPVTPWDGEQRIKVTASQIAAAFEENARLKEYARLEDHQLTDPNIAPPYVTELFMDLTKRAHAVPAARNVYLNPKRADQALVHMTTGKWEVVPLQEATRLILDGVAKSMVRVTLSSEERRHLPLEAQNALAMAGLLYDDEPEEYAKRARAPMAAHLSNTVPLIGV